MEKVAIFIDEGCLSHIMRDSFNERIDYKKLVEQLSHGYILLRAYHYNCPPYKSNPPTEDEKKRESQYDKFTNCLSQIEKFEIRSGKLAFRGVDNKGKPKFDQKRVDVMLAVDMVNLAATGKIDKAILIAGDSDFVPAIQIVKHHGVIVELWHGQMSYGKKGTVHRELWKECDVRIQFTREFIELIKR